MAETRKIAAILAADVVGYSRLVGADEDRTLSRLRGLRGDLARRHEVEDVPLRILKAPVGPEAMERNAGSA